MIMSEWTFNIDSETVSDLASCEQCIYQHWMIDHGEAVFEYNDVGVPNDIEDDDRIFYAYKRQEIDGCANYWICMNESAYNDMVD